MAEDNITTSPPSTSWPINRTGDAAPTQPSRTPFPSPTRRNRNRLPPMPQPQLDAHLDALLNPNSQHTIPLHLTPPRVEFGTNSKGDIIFPHRLSPTQAAFPMSTMIQTGWLIEAIVRLESEGLDYTQAPCPTGVPERMWELVRMMPRETIEGTARVFRGHVDQGRR